jgi:hypothetical protein
LVCPETKGFNQCFLKSLNLTIERQIPSQDWGFWQMIERFGLNVEDFSGVLAVF